MIFTIVFTMTVTLYLSKADSGHHVRENIDHFNCWDSAWFLEQTIAHLLPVKLKYYIFILFHKRQNCNKHKRGSRSLDERNISVENDVHHSVNLWMSNCKYMKQFLETVWLFYPQTHKMNQDYTGWAFKYLPFKTQHVSFPCFQTCKLLLCVQLSWCNLLQVCASSFISLSRCEWPHYRLQS